MSSSVLILDFGSQVTQLIARRVRENGVYCEIYPFNKADEAIDSLDPAAIILSGGPASVIAAEAPIILALKGKVSIKLKAMKYKRKPDNPPNK